MALYTRWYLWRSQSCTAILCICISCRKVQTEIKPWWRHNLWSRQTSNKPAVYLKPVLISLRVAMLVCFKKKKRKQTRKWLKKWLLDINTYSDVTELRQLKTNEQAYYKNYDKHYYFYVYYLVFPSTVSSWESILELPRVGISVSKEAERPKYHKWSTYTSSAEAPGIWESKPLSSFRLNQRM